jgi:hypothetical protein
MSILLFIIYLILFTWLVYRVPFFKKSGLTPFWLTAFFWTKILAGIAYGLYHTTIPNYFAEADTWRFFLDSKAQTQLIIHDPVRFIAELLENPFEKKYRHFFSSHNSFWNDLRHIYMVKLVAIMNIFSGSNYYINVIFFEFLTFFGPVAIIRVFNHEFKGKLQIIAGAMFAIPSFVFWSSGIHKDGLVFMVIGLITYFLHQYFTKTRSVRLLAYVFVLLLLIFPLRNYVVLAVLPALIAWWWASAIKRYQWVPFVVIALVGTVLFFTAKFIHPKIDLPVAIVMRNNEFIKLGGNSMMTQPELKSNFVSFLMNAPSALNHALARPYLHEINSVTYFLSAIEITALWIIVIIWFFRHYGNPYKKPVILFLLMLSMIVLLLTGYIVPQMGALVRYRSLYLPLMIIPLMCTTNWKKHIKNINI